MKEDHRFSWHIKVASFVNGEVKEFGYGLMPMQDRDDYFGEGKTYPAYAAFTVAELGEMLPALNGTGWCTVEKLIDSWHCAFLTSSGKEKIAFDAPTMADAMASMLIHLKEQGIV